MAAPNALPDAPPQLKAIQAYLRIASDVDRIDPVVGYWVRLFSTESALKIDRESPECKTFLGSLIMWLEKFKQANKDNETVSNQTVGQAHMENFIVKLFNKADTVDRAGAADKNTVRMFYMAALLFEAMAVFGPLTEDVAKRAKYAKFKAAYIQKCFKTGETPHPGPLEEDPPAAGESQQSQPTNDSSNSGGGGIFDLPEVPTDKSEDEQKPLRPPELPKTNDPFIMTPGSPPKPSTRPIAPTIPPSPPQVCKPQPSTPSVISSSGSTISATKFHATNGAPLAAQDLLDSQRFLKFAHSALQYDDITTAVANLEKVMKILTLGEKPKE